MSDPVRVFPAFQSQYPDSGDATKFGPDAWNADRMFGGGTNGQIPYRDSTSPTGAIWGDPPSGGGGVTDPVTVSTIQGGTATTSSITIKPTTSGAAAAGADIILAVGNNGAREGIRVKHDGTIGFGIASPAASRQFHFHNPSSANANFQITHSSSGTGNTNGVLVGLQTNDLFIWNYQNGQVQIATNNLAGLTVSATGVVTFDRAGFIANAGCTIKVADNATALSIINTGQSNKTWLIYPSGTGLRVYESSASADRISIAAGGVVTFTQASNPHIIITDGTKTIRVGMSTAANGLITGSGNGSVCVRASNGSLLFSCDDGTTPHFTIETTGLLAINGRTSSFPALKRSGAALQVRVADDTAFAQLDALQMAVVDGVTAPSATVGQAKIYVDTADGDLKVIFGDGVVKTLAADT